MTSNHEEFSYEITLKFKMFIANVVYWGCTYLCRKSNEGTKVINLAFGNIL